jgi:glucose/arabinose dehydrogenase
LSKAKAIVYFELPPVVTIAYSYRMKKILLVALALVSVFSVATVSAETGFSKQGRKMAEAGQNISVVVLPSGLSAAQVQNSIVASLTEHTWTIVSKEDGKVVAELNALERRNLYGRFTITYDTKLVTVTDNSTDEKGQPIVAIRWFKYFQQGLLKNANSIALGAK